jgi:long-chain acyl-CoA synthetase
MSFEPLLARVLGHAARDRARTAIVHSQGIVSYGAFATAVGGAAAALARHFGVRAGDRVLLSAEPSPAFLATYLAVHALGATAVPVDARAPAARLASLATRFSPKVLVAGEPGGGIPVPVARYSELAAPGREPRAPADLSPEQIADVLLTTGTTADAKAVMLSHRALVKAVLHINEVVGTRAGDVEVLALPLHHSFGLNRARAVLASGATLVLTSGFVDGAELAEALARHRATGFASVPAGIAILMMQGGTRLARLARQLRYLELGSSPMPVEQKRELMRLLPRTRICMHYGLTEASRSAFLSFHEDRERLDSLGRPSPGVEMRVAAPAGETGEIEIRGEHVMSGYWQAPELTAEVLRDGWLRTGDLGRVDPDGYFHLEGRVDEVINVGGRKVLPREIEEVLLGHPAVGECACVGMPDPQGLAGEMIGVWMVPRAPAGARPTFSELAKLLREKLEPYKIPRRFEWTDELPKTPSGKVLKHALRERG